MPWFERPIVYDLQSRPLTLKSVTGSQGKQKESLKYLMHVLDVNIKIQYRFANG